MTVDLPFEDYFKNVDNPLDQDPDIIESDAITYCMNLCTVNYTDCFAHHWDKAATRLELAILLLLQFCNL